MKLIFETQSGSSFEIEVDNSDTLLMVKQKIETSQNIPVSEQVLVVDCAVILREDLNVEECKIVQESHLQILREDLNPDHNNDQVLQPEQSPEPFVSVEEYFESRDWPLTADEIEKIYSAQPLTVQTKESSPSSNSVRENSTNIQDQSQPSDAAKQIINSNQDSSSTSVNENINIQDSPLNVLMRNIAVRVSIPIFCVSNPLFFVNTTDHVRTLRTRLQNRLGNLNWLGDRYIFKEKERVLDEDQSFHWNGVGQFSKIEIVLLP